MTMGEKHRQPGIGVNVFVERLIDGQRFILLGLRIGKVGKGKWSVPGGHLELGEQFGVAATRELSEETGLKAKTSSLEYVHLVNTPDSGYIHINFRINAEQCDGNLHVPEAEEKKFKEWKYFPLNALPENLFNPKIFEVLREGRTFADYKH